MILPVYLTAGPTRPNGSAMPSGKREGRLLKCKTLHIFMTMTPETQSIIPEPRFLLAAYLPLAELEGRYFSQERPSAEHLKALLHMNDYNVPGDLPWRLIVGWRPHEPLRISRSVVRSVSPVTSGSAETPTADTAIYLRLVEQERFIDGGSGLILKDFQHLLASLASLLLERRESEDQERKAG